MTPVGPTLRSRRLWAMLAGAGLGLLALSGCVADDSAQVTPPRPPEELRPSSVTLAAYPLIDDDANGYPDTVPVLVYLWDPRYPLPMWAEGEMRFQLRDAEDRLIAEWDVPADIVASSRRRDSVGAAHALTLDIRDATGDIRPLTNVRLQGEFLGVDGSTAQTARPVGIRIGA